MTARKKAESTEETAPAAETAPSTSSPSKAVGGLAELQAQADTDTAKGFKGPEEES